MKKPRSAFFLAVVGLPLFGFVLGVLFLVGTESTGSFVILPGLAPGAKVFLTFCGVSLFLITIRVLTTIIRKLWTKNLVVYRIAAYLIGAIYLYGAFLLFDWLVNK